MFSLFLYYCFIIHFNYITPTPTNYKQEPKVIPATCQACYPTDPEKINVHLVPHSHDDVGWLKTVDQYYYGNKKYIQYAGVQYIISSSIQALKGHPQRRFVQVESAFFWKWWQNQEETLKREVIELVNNGQLEILNGAWSMNDEAACHYQSLIDQFTWGFRFLNDSLGDCARPKIGWQIDPFGHSREHASILNQLGFQALVIGRLDYRDKTKRKENRNLDFIWDASANLNNSQIFTTIFPEFYLSIDGFCFDVLCNFESINDDESSPEYNIKEKIRKFTEKMIEFRNYYQTSNILLPMGGDFNYQAAEINFSNMDKLIRAFKGNPKINVFYSTPSCYVRAVNEEVNAKELKLSKKTDDFFPYASETHAYWTGYFTSRPTFKRFERIGNKMLQVVKQLSTFSKIKDNSINDLREVMGIIQHHDAITGTAKQAVADDYVRLLTRAIRNAEVPAGFIISDLLKIQPTNEIDLNLRSCLLTNISICETTKSDKFIVTVYNPISRPVDYHVRLPVDQNHFKITGPNGEINYDVFENISNFKYVKETAKPSSRELIFLAKQIPPLGLQLYHVEATEKAEQTHQFENFEGSATFGTELNNFVISGETGKLQSVTINGLMLNITQDFLFYRGSRTTRASGAYIFRPIDKEADILQKEKIQIKAKRGKLLDEVLQIYNSEVTQIIRVYKDNSNYIEFDWLVGNLQTSNGYGREVITRFRVEDFHNEKVFYTDSNGREQIRREVNKRNDYEYNENDEIVSGNYYPVTSKIVIKDEKKNLEVAVLTDRAQGGTSLKDGFIELMVHRRLVSDDGFGVGEALKEDEYGSGMYARGSHYLTFGTIHPNSKDGITEKSTAAFERNLAQKLLLAPWVAVGDAQNSTLEQIQKTLKFEFSGLIRALPENVHLLTLEPWRDNGTYLLRLEHILEKNEDIVLSKPITIDLEDLFAEFQISEIGETTLGANQWLDEYELEEKFVWNNVVPTDWTKLNPEDPLKIELSPMQIRTFIIKVEKRTE